MKKAILIGNVASGKTTICQYLNNQNIEYKKTQSFEVIDSFIDTPGEYLENVGMRKNLIIGSVEAQIVIFVQDASSCDRYNFSPGIASMFTQQVIGVVNKIDIAKKKDIVSAGELLELAGASPVLYTSALSGEGMEELRKILEG